MPLRVVEGYGLIRLRWELRRDRGLSDGRGKTVDRPRLSRRKGLISRICERRGFLSRGEMGSGQAEAVTMQLERRTARPSSPNPPIRRDQAQGTDTGILTKRNAPNRSSALQGIKPGQGRSRWVKPEKIIAKARGVGRGRLPIPAISKWAGWDEGDRCSGGLEAGGGNTKQRTETTQTTYKITGGRRPPLQVLAGAFAVEFVA